MQVFDDLSIHHRHALPPVDRRRPYRLTGLGEATVRAQLERLRGFTRTGLDRLRKT